MAPAAVALVSTADQSPNVCFPARHRGVATVAELLAVQTRIAALAAVELLTAAELDTIDDLVADFVAGASESERWAGAQAVANMVELHVAFSDDVRLTRQLRRRVLV
jgi:hypothetical protein